MTDAREELARTVGMTMAEQIPDELMTDDAFEAVRDAIVADLAPVVSRIRAEALRDAGAQIDLSEYYVDPMALASAEEFAERWLRARADREEQGMSIEDEARTEGSNAMSTCSDCGRDRTPEDDDYTPIQMMLNQPLGWYSGSDGELCPKCFTALMRLANGR